MVLNQEKIRRLLGEKPSREPNLWTKIYAFMLRDLRDWATYKLWLALDLAGTLFNAAAYFLFSNIVTPQRLIGAGYEGDYLTFAAIGLALQQYVFFAVQGVVESIRDEQNAGTIETVLSSPTGLKTFLLGASVFRFIVATAYFTAVSALGLLAGAKVALNPETLPVAVAVVMLVITSHLPIGFLAAAVTLRAKVGEPVAVAFSWLTQLVSGVLYPLNLLPTWLAPLALLTPLTYSLEATRRLLLSGETISSQAVYGNIFNTLIYSAIAIPLSLIAFRGAYRSALRRGELGQY